MSAHPHLFRVAAAIRSAAHSRAELRAALVAANRELQDGRSTAWACMQARRALDGRSPIQRPIPPGGAAA